MNNEKFEKDLKNKELSINQSLDKCKSILETLRHKQAATRTDMLNSIPGTKEFKDLQNIWISLKKMVIDAKQVQELLLRKKYSLDSLVEDYAADAIINSNLNPDDVSVQERQAVYNSRLAHLERGIEDFDNILNNISSSDTSVSDSIGSFGLSDLLQPDNLQSDTDDLTQDSADVTVDESRVSSDPVIEEGQASSSGIAFERQAWLSTNRSTLEEQPGPSGLRPQRNIQQMPVAREQSDQIVMEEGQQDSSNILSEGLQVFSNNPITEAPQTSSGLRPRQALNSNICQMPVTSEESDLFAPIQSQSRESSDINLVERQQDPSNMLSEGLQVFPNHTMAEAQQHHAGLRPRRVLNRNIRQMPVTSEESDLFAPIQSQSRESSDINLVERQQDPSNMLSEGLQVFPNHTIAETQQNLAVLRPRRALNRNICQMPVTEEQPLQTIRANNEHLRLALSDSGMVQNQWGPTNLLASSRYFPNHPRIEEQPGSFILRPRDALNRNMQQILVAQESPVQLDTRANDENLSRTLSDHFMAEEQRGASNLLASSRYFPNWPIPNEQPGASGLRPQQTLNRNNQEMPVSEEQPGWSTSLQQAADSGHLDSNRLADLAESVARAASDQADAHRHRLPRTTAEDDLRNTRPLLTFPEVRKINEAGNIILQFHKSISVELTRDLGICISLPNSGITIAASAHNQYFGLIHPQGKFYQRNRELQIQILNCNEFERVARITNDDRLIIMHNRSDKITELTDLGPMQIDATTFFDLTRNFTKDIFYSEGRHGPSQAEICSDLLETAMVERLAAFDRFILDDIKIIQTTNGSLTIYKNADNLKLQIFPLTGGIRINTPLYILKADLRPNFLNFLVQRTFNRVISHNERFIIRRKRKTCGYDAYNIFHENFRRIRNEPHYSSDDEDLFI